MHEQASVVAMRSVTVFLPECVLLLVLMMLPADEQQQNLHVMPSRFLGRSAYVVVKMKRKL